MASEILYRNTLIIIQNLGLGLVASDCTLLFFGLKSYRGFQEKGFRSTISEEFLNPTNCHENAARFHWHAVIHAPQIASSHRKIWWKAISINGRPKLYILFSRSTHWTFEMENVHEEPHSSITEYLLASITFHRCVAFLRSINRFANAHKQLRGISFDWLVGCPRRSHVPTHISTTRWLLIKISQILIYGK